MDDKKLIQMIADVFKKYGNYETVVMLDNLKDMCFHYSTIFCNTISVSDILIPKAKASLMQKAEEEVKAISKQYHDGILTDEERYQKTISIWTYTNDEITKEMIDELEKDRGGSNDLHIMAALRGQRQQTTNTSARRYARLDGQTLRGHH